MEASEKKNTSTKILIGIIVLLLTAMGTGAYFYFNQQEESAQAGEMLKQSLEEQYGQLSLDYEHAKINLRNDSILYKLTNEQMKVQRLLEELKKVKADNKAEIARLHGELNNLRNVLKSYVAQIDSLNRANAQLRQEKQEITDKYQQTARSLDEVSQERQNLSEKVTLAAKLDATGISVQATNKKGKVQKKIDKVEQLVINFLITKNITAEPGERTIYIRIMKPDNDALVKSRSNVFRYENKDINYSIRKIVEYGGEEIPVTMYWNVEEYLMPGTYRVDIFADGNRIGSRSFTLE